MLRFVTFLAMPVEKVFETETEFAESDDAQARYSAFRKTLSP